MITLRQFSRNAPWLAFTLVFLSGISGMAQNRSNDQIVRLGLTTSMIETELNQADTLAATRVWASAMGQGNGLWKDSDVQIYDGAASLIAAVNKGEADIISMGTQEFVEVESQLHAIPVLTYMQGGHVENEYLILVRQDSSIKTISDLRGKRMALPRGGRNSMASLWLDGLLDENGLPGKAEFFRELKDVQKPSQTILPIFFKQLEAGIVLRSAYDTAVALNPQIGRQLEVLAASSKFVWMVICLRTGISPEKREQYIRQALKLHEKANGLQALNIFRIDRLVLWDPSYLNTVREFLKKCKPARPATRLQARSNTPDLVGTGK
jgi:ABC-type phosphate/phosphonate transport system substrate-binding protein